ncbi:hypothetical protein EPI10_020164 [Gossypium australe]|uniref:Uncharacterized protein n=1 Tax=Gossypium australe TaxID=47621 RepID=A0A5B6WD27_9ROSI|nr:hypothetical protein EPI10_020164 [Gossypium australe]
MKRDRCFMAFEKQEVWVPKGAKDIGINLQGPKIIWHIHFEFKIQGNILARQSPETCYCKYRNFMISLNT